MKLVPYTLSYNQLKARKLIAITSLQVNLIRLLIFWLKVYGWSPETCSEKNFQYLCLDGFLKLIKSQV